jgi:hypothetical protein
MRLFSGQRTAHVSREFDHAGALYGHTPCADRPCTVPLAPFQPPAEVSRGAHAAMPSDDLRGVQGSMLSSVSICASDRSAMTGCRQPVVRIMWIAKGRAGVRLPPTICDA